MPEAHGLLPSTVVSNLSACCCRMTYVAVGLVQAALLLPLFIFCYYMYEWETDEANQVCCSCQSKQALCRCANKIGRNNAFRVHLHRSPRKLMPCVLAGNGSQ